IPCPAARVADPARSACPATETRATAAHRRCSTGSRQEPPTTAGSPPQRRFACELPFAGSPNEARRREFWHRRCLRANADVPAVHAAPVPELDLLVSTLNSAPLNTILLTGARRSSIEENAGARCRRDRGAGLHPLSCKHRGWLAALESRPGNPLILGRLDGARPEGPGLEPPSGVGRGG